MTENTQEKEAMSMLKKIVGGVAVALILSLIAWTKNSINETLSELAELQTKVGDLEDLLESELEWPDAINCGGSFDALFILNSNDLSKDLPGGAFYVQVGIHDEDRWVQFNPDGSFKETEHGTSPGSASGCLRRSIQLLSEDGRTYRFLKWTGRSPDHK